MKCPECNNEIDLNYIRDFMRDKDISKSKLGQWVHDRLPNTFYWLDIDGIVYKRATRILRIIEEKRPGQQLKNSQRDVLSKLAIAIDYLIGSDIVSPHSGVFILWTESPWGRISQLCNDEIENLKLSQNQLKCFLSGQPIKIEE